KTFALHMSNEHRCSAPVRTLFHCQYATAPELIALSLHDALPISGGNTYRDEGGEVRLAFPRARYVVQAGEWEWAHSRNERVRAKIGRAHSELQSRENIVCRLLLEKKKTRHL